MSDRVKDPLQVSTYLSDSSGMFYIDVYLECPYNPSHVLMRHRIQGHLVRCAKSRTKAGEMCTCPFNATHVMPIDMFEKHTQECPEIRYLIAYKYEYEPMRVADVMPIENREIKTSESWDDLDIPTYDPSTRLKDAKLLVQLKGATPSEREQFREERRKLQEELKRSKSVSLSPFDVSSGAESAHDDWELEEEDDSGITKSDSSKGGLKEFLEQPRAWNVGSKGPFSDDDSPSRSSPPGSVSSASEDSVWTSKSSHSSFNLNNGKNLSGGAQLTSSRASNVSIKSSTSTVSHPSLSAFGRGGGFNGPRDYSGYSAGHPLRGDQRPGAFVPWTKPLDYVVDDRPPAFGPTFDDAEDLIKW